MKHDDKAVDAAVQELYAALSSDPGSWPDFDRLGALFLPGALAVEYGADGEPEVKPIDGHIGQMRSAFADHACLGDHGFSEVETGREVRLDPPVASVRSAYRKTYHNGTALVTGTGVNHITLVRQDGRYKISAIAWTED